MGTVHANQGEKARQKGAARRPGARFRHADELGELDRQKGCAEDKRRRCEQQEYRGLAPFGGKHPDTAGIARQQQARGLDEHIAQIEELAPGRSAGGVARQHRIGGKQRGKQHDVAEDEDPEPVSDDGTGRGQATAIPS